VLRERDGVWTMEGPTYGSVETVASPVRLGRTPASLRRPAPALGEHTEELGTRGWGEAGPA
jgi:crotonobetainyl-CoA:carnitine CoA-transferase CaiB-like acyl-CoA transferase